MGTSSLWTIFTELSSVSYLFYSVNSGVFIFSALILAVAPVLKLWHKLHLRARKLVKPFPFYQLLTLTASLKPWNLQSPYPLPSLTIPCPDPLLWSSLLLPCIYYYLTLTSFVFSFHVCLSVRLLRIGSITFWCMGVQSMLIRYNIHRDFIGGSFCKFFMK